MSQKRTGEKHEQRGMKVEFYTLSKFSCCGSNCENRCSLITDVLLCVGTMNTSTSVMQPSTLYFVYVIQVSSLNSSSYMCSSDISSSDGCTVKGENYTETVD